MENSIKRENFESYSDYINALKSEDVMGLSRRQLQNLARHYMEQAKEKEDWEKAETAFRYHDLAINEVGSTAEVVQRAVQAMLQILPDDDESEKIDAVMSKMQEQNRKRTQNMVDRKRAKEENQSDEDKLTKEDIDIEQFRREFNPPTGPDVEDTDFYVYQFSIGEGEDQRNFDFRVMKIDNPAYRHFESEWSEEEIPEDASWVANQYGGIPSIGSQNYFESLDDVEDRIKEVMIAAGTDKTLDEITNQGNVDGEKQQ